MSDRGAKVLKKESALKASRSSWDSWWQDIAEHVMPRKSHVTETAFDSPDYTDTERLYDTTALLANQTLARGMHTHITPAAATFATVEPPKGNQWSYDVRNWFHDATKTIRDELTRSNFHQEVGEFYLEHSGFGTGAMFCEWNARLGKLVFKSHNVGTYSISEDETGKVNTFYRTYRLKPAQIMLMFGDDCPPSVKEKAANDATKEVELEIVHAIEPRENYDPEKVDAENMPISSCYVLRETKEVIRESGYMEFPFAVARWLRWGNSPWGWSPSSFALPIIHQLNFLEQCTDVGVERVAFPAWMVPDTMKGEFDPRPHGQNIYSPSNGGDTAMPTELAANGRLDIAMQREEQKRDVIREHFHEGLFRTVSRRDKVMTAREVSRIEAEQASDFHPFFAQLTSEFLEPIVLRVFAELLRNNRLPSPPPELFEQVGGVWEMQDPSMKFNSRLGLAFEQAEALGLLEIIDELNPMAQIMGPEVYDWLDTDKAGPMLARAKGVSPEIFRTGEGMEALKQGRAERAQAEAAAKQTQQVAGAVGSLGGVDAAEQLLGN